MSATVTIPEGLMSGAQRRVVIDALEERRRQHRLKAEGRFRHTCDDPALDDMNLYAILGEEVGEVGHEVNEAFDKEVERTPHLRDELIQVIAVAMAWVERIDGQAR